LHIEVGEIVQQRREIHRVTGPLPLNPDRLEVQVSCLHVVTERAVNRGEVVRTRRELL
jgi:hypothetical protein